MGACRLWSDYKQSSRYGHATSAYLAAKASWHCLRPDRTSCAASLEENPKAVCDYQEGIVPWGGGGNWSYVSVAMLQIRGGERSLFVFEIGREKCWRRAGDKTFGQLNKAYDF